MWGRDALLPFTLRNVGRRRRYLPDAARAVPDRAAVQSEADVEALLASIASSRGTREGPRVSGAGPDAGR